MKLKKNTKLLALSSILMFDLAANASYHDELASSADFLYIDIKAGVVIPISIKGNSDLQSVAPDASYTAGFAFGRKFMDRFGTELEYMYRGKSDIDSSSNAGVNTNKWSVISNTFMFNLTADMVTGGVVRPYVKLGAGVSINKADQYKYSLASGTINQTWNGSTSSNFAWQAGFGIAMITTNAIETKIEYAFVDRGEFKTTNGVTLTTSGGVSSTDSSAAHKTGQLRDQVITLGIGYKL